MRVVFIYIFLFSSAILRGQVSGSSTERGDKDDPFIGWIASVPTENEKSNSGFFDKIVNFLVGYEPVVFESPVNVYANGTDDYFIVNQGNGTIIHYQNGKTILLPAFKKADISFPSLLGICSVRSDRLLFTDSKLNRVYFMSNEGKQLESFITDTLHRPTGIAFSGITGEIWIVETGSHCISAFDINGVRKRTIGRRGNGPLEFNFPTYIWIDAAGQIYIVDSMNFRIQILSSKGDFLSSFGQQGDATGYFARPRGIATDSKGNIYVADALFNAIQIFDISGRLLYYFGSQGEGKFQFRMPSGIFIDKNDFIYVSDSYNSRVQIFQLKKNSLK